MLLLFFSILAFDLATTFLFLSTFAVFVVAFVARSTAAATAVARVTYITSSHLPTAIIVCHLSPFRALTQTTCRVCWVAESGQGFTLDYPSISLHAVSRDLSSFPNECLYLMLDAGSEQQEDAQHSGKLRQTIICNFTPFPPDGLFSIFRFTPAYTRVLRTHIRARKKTSLCVCDTLDYFCFRKLTCPYSPHLRYTECIYLHSYRRKLRA